MKVAGIIAEYNPFHNGHAYLLQKARELTGADYCIAVMSGDFVQRGAPAIYDKYTRARMALLSGADLVLELPAAFSCGSAEDFASCGVAVLDRLGVVDTLCFGSECGQTEPLLKLARLFCEEPEDYRRILTDGLKNGLSFPLARSKAAQACLAARTSLTEETGVAADVQIPRPRQAQTPLTEETGVAATVQIPCPRQAQTSFTEETDGAATVQIPFLRQTQPPLSKRTGGQNGADVLPANGRAPESINRLLSSPNDILGIEYCKALLRLNSRIKPIAVLRCGSTHHDTVPADADALVFPSSTALREILEAHGSGCLRQNFRRLSEGVPAAVLSLIRGAVPLRADDFSVLLSQRLLELQLCGRPLTDFYDVPTDLAARIGRRAPDFSSFTQRTAALKTRQYTYTRISRALLHILLDITAEEAQSRKEHGFVPYLRILGFRKSAGPLLSAIKKAASLPLITKTADAASILDPYALTMFRRDLYRSHLYQSVLTAKSGKQMPNEYTASVIVLPETSSGPEVCAVSDPPFSSGLPD